MNLKGKIIYFYGLSGSGKTTLSDLLAKHLDNDRELNPGFRRITDTTEGVLCKYGQGIQRLDGDNVRQELTRDLGFSLEDRFEHIRRVAFVADLLSRHGVTVISSFITPLTAMRIYLRQKFGNRLILVYLHCPIHECIRRDVKGLYKKALSGEIKEFTGLTQTFEYPRWHCEEEFDFEIPTSDYSEEECLEYLIVKLSDICD